MIFKYPIDIDCDIVSIDSTPHELLHTLATSIVEIMRMDGWWRILRLRPKHTQLIAVIPRKLSFSVLSLQVATGIIDMGRRGYRCVITYVGQLIARWPRPVPSSVEMRLPCLLPLLRCHATDSEIARPRLPSVARMAHGDHIASRIVGVAF